MTHIHHTNPKAIGLQCPKVIPPESTDMILTMLHHHAAEDHEHHADDRDHDGADDHDHDGAHDADDRWGENKSVPMPMMIIMIVGGVRSPR